MKIMPFRLPSQPFLIAGLLSLWLNAADAATLAVSPSTISNAYNGYVTLTIGGLTNTETVLIEKFADANTNGVIDAGDFLVQSFRLTDGQASTIAGVTNINVPGDATSANSAITALLNFSAIQPDHIIGKYAFKLSSPSGRFTPVTNIFTITNSTYPQSFTGTVKSSGTNVANAFVILLAVDPSGKINDFGGGTVANNSGSYTFKTAPGTYLLFAVKSNFVADFTAPVITLGVSNTITTNLTMLPATARSISGKMFDAANTNTVLPGIFLHPQSTNNFIAIGWTGSGGNFTVPVTASKWRLSPDDADLALHGYVRPHDETNADTTAVNATNITFALTKATALFYGSIKDDLNNPLVGLFFSADEDSNQYDSSGSSDASGNYAVAVTSGNWCVNPNADDPRFSSYVFSQSDCTNITDGQAVRVNFTVKRATNTISGYVKNSGNIPIVGAQVSANDETGYQSQDSITDTNGFYSLNVANGTWHVYPNCGCGDCDHDLNKMGYQCVNEQIVNISNNNGVASFTVLLLGEPVLGQLIHLSNGQVGAYLSGTVGSNYTILVSTNITLPMANWSPVFVTNLTTSPVLLVDPQPTNRQLFYRALLGP